MHAATVTKRDLGHGAILEDEGGFAYDLETLQDPQNARRGEGTDEPLRAPPPKRRAIANET